MFTVFGYYQDMEFMFLDEIILRFYIWKARIIVRSVCCRNMIYLLIKDIREIFYSTEIHIVNRMTAFLSNLNIIRRQIYHGRAYRVSFSS